MITGVVSDLVGAVVIARDRSYGNDQVIARGRVRAVTTNKDGDLRLWIEEFDPKVWQSVEWHPAPPRPETAGSVVAALIGHEQSLTIIEDRKKKA